MGDAGVQLGRGVGGRGQLIGALIELTSSSNDGVIPPVPEQAVSVGSRGGFLSERKHGLPAELRRV
jgi:hypothetical protein